MFDAPYLGIVIFQFLIKGYKPIGCTHGETSQHFQFLIKGYQMV